MLIDRILQMYVRRDGSVQGPLTPKYIEEIVLDKLEKVLALITCEHIVHVKCFFLQKNSALPAVSSS